MQNHATTFYQRAWRWHFFAGLVVAPFLILLSVTGIIYLFKPQLDDLMYSQLLKVAPTSQAMPADHLLMAAEASMPTAHAIKYLPPTAADRSAQVILREGDNEWLVFVNPADARVLGKLDNKHNLQARPAHCMPS